MELLEGQKVIDDNGNVYLTEKGDTLLESSLYIDAKQLRDAFPALYDEYITILEGKKPKISVTTTDVYDFHPSLSEPLTDYFVFKYYVFYRDGNVIETFDAFKYEDKPKASKFVLQPSDAVMVCDYGHYKACELFVHPDFMNPEQIEGNTELTSPEIYALLITNSIVSSYRMDYFAYPMSKAFGNDITVSNYRNFKVSKDDFKADAKALDPHAKGYKDLFYDTVFPLLASKGLVKINAKGSIQITLDGKNQAERYR